MIKTPHPKSDDRVYKKMRWIDIFLYCTGCVRLHKDGDGFSFVFRFWHPMTWLALVAMVLPCALLGERLTAVIPLRLSPFWQANKDQLQRVKPWTRLGDLKPFRREDLKT